jgi:TRAP-type C4-dicarboxylate transport system substrate-binding protein
MIQSRSAQSLVAVVLIASCGAVEAASVKLSYTTPSNPSNVSSPVLTKWADELKAASDGEIEIEFFWQQALSKLADNLKAVSTGLADIGNIAPGYSRKDMPLAYLSSTSFGSGDPYVVAEAWNRTRMQVPSIAQEDWKNGIKYLFNASIGPVVLIGNKHYKTPGDFAGATMRLSSHFRRTASKFGWNVNPARIRFPEMYTALGKGTISGGSAYMNQIIPRKLNEVARYMVVLDLGQHMNMCYMNQSVWEGLSEKARNALEASLPQLIVTLAKAEIDSAATAIERLAGDPKYPMDIYRLDETERAEWAEKLQVSYEANIEKAAKVDANAHKIAGAYLAHIEVVAAEVKAKGYPWER